MAATAMTGHGRSPAMMRQPASHAARPMSPAAMAENQSGERCARSAMKPAGQVSAGCEGSMAPVNSGGRRPHPAMASSSGRSYEKRSQESSLLDGESVSGLDMWVSNC